jgi:hypothetical protein
MQTVLIGLISTIPQLRETDAGRPNVRRRHELKNATYFPASTLGQP